MKTAIIKMVSNRWIKAETVQQWLVVGMANMLLIVGSYLTIANPFVPITMQTLAVSMVGLMLGPVAGFATVLLWLAEALVGLPVLANGTSGPLVFVGPTAGYLFSFPIMAYMVGYFRQHRLIVLTCSVLVAHLVCLVMGSVWLVLIMNISLAQALQLGCYPFVLGSLIKTALLICLFKFSQSVKRWLSSE